MTGIKTNPNAFGGSFNYDSRTGLGYGQTSNGGLGSDWNMGDALSSPKGEWDDEIEELELDDEDELEGDIEISYSMSIKSPTSGSQFNRDSGSGKSSRDPFSFNGLANTSAAVIAASYKRRNKLIKEYVKEIILSELSGSIAASRLGKAYPKTKTTGSGNGRMLSVDPKHGINHGTSYINQKGYGNSAKTPDLDPYVKPGKATTDGAETLGGLRHIDIDEDESSAEALFNDLDRENRSSFDRHVKINHYFH